MRKAMIFLILCLCAQVYGVQKINFETMNTTRGAVKVLNSRFDDIDSRLLNAENGQNLGTGKIFYVDSAVGSDNNQGKAPAQATATIDAAINLCTANRGDIIYVMQGHAETIDNGTSDAIDADVAGITIIGLGNGSDRPTITYDTTTDEFVIDAAGVVVSNLRFVPGVSDISNAIEMKADSDYSSIMNCEFVEGPTSSFEFTIGIQFVTGADDVLIAQNTYFSADAVGATRFIDGGAGVLNRTMIAYNVIHGQFTVSAIFSDQIDLETYIVGNLITQMTSGQHCIEYTAAATGICADNFMFTDAEATTLDPGSMKCYENYVTTAINASGVLVPFVDDTTLTILGTDDADNAYASTSVASNADGSVLERLEYIQANSAYWQEKTVSITGATVSTSDDLFDVDGGPILITNFVGIVTTQIQNQATVVEIILDADSPATDHDFSTAVDLDNDAVGTRYVFTDANESVLTPLEGADAGATVLMSGWFCSEGMIEVGSGAASTGNCTWYLTYKPLATGVTVTAQ